MLGFFDQGQDIIPLVNQGDADTDITGDWVSMRNYDFCTILIAKYGTEDVDTFGVQIVQATDVSGTAAKAVSGKYTYRYKQGTLTSQTVWTAGQLATADDILGIGSAAPTGGTLVNTVDVNTDAFLLAIDVPASFLDVSNGFDCLSVQLEGDESNNALLITAWAILSGARFPQKVPISAIS